MIGDKKLQFFIPKELIDRLKKEKEKTGAPVSEIIRRAVDKFLKEQEQDANG